jgi:site-specific recombinase XerD
MDNADYNHELKTIGLLAQTSLPLHSHLARHTFATWMLSNGVKVENLRRMLGHKNIQQTMRYAKVLAQSVHDDYAMVEAKLDDLNLVWNKYEEWLTSEECYEIVYSITL